MYAKFANNFVHCTLCTTFAGYVINALQPPPPSSFSLYVHPIISGVITYPEVVGLPSVNAVSGADDVVLVH